MSRARRVASRSMKRRSSSLSIRALWTISPSVTTKATLRCHIFVNCSTGITDIPQVGIGQKDVILDDSPEDAEMLVAEDFHRHDAGLAQGPKVRNLGLVARTLIAQLFHKALHVQEREGPQLLDLLLVAVLDKALDNLLFR